MPATTVVYPLDVLDAAFRRLAEGRAPLHVTGRDISPRLPERRLTVVELRDLLLRPYTDFGTRDAAIRLLVRRAQEHGGEWVVALTGTLLPGLRRTLAPLVKACPGASADVEAEALAGLVEAAFEVPADTERIAAKLIWAATRRAHRMLTGELAIQARHAPLPGSIEPPRPWSHPDFVLAEAARCNVISHDDAELIGETRLGGMSVRAYAEQRGTALQTVRMRRFRAEQKLVHWILSRRACSKSAAESGL